MKATLHVIEPPSPPLFSLWARLTKKRAGASGPEASESPRDLSKSLTRLDLVVIGVAQIIGAGIVLFFSVLLVFRTRMNALVARGLWLLGGLGIYFSWVYFSGRFGGRQKVSRT